jgi:DNA-binding transcriptional ArsR family regulator
MPDDDSPLRPITPEEQSLAKTLDALGNPVRVRILKVLRRRRSLGDIRVPGERDERPEGKDAPVRPISRQAVKLHLQRLMGVGVVVPIEGARGEGPKYLVDHRRLFRIAEEFRAFATLEPEEELSADTVFLPGGRARDAAPGPHLLLVRGLREGRAFPLAVTERTPTKDGRPYWMIGRRRGLAVSLDYDQFVSSENSIVWRTDDGGFEVESLASSRNGTTVNFSPLKGDSPRRRLSHGDLVGVGRTMLLFREK